MNDAMSCPFLMLHCPAAGPGHRKAVLKQAAQRLCETAERSLEARQQEVEAGSRCAGAR